MNRIFSGTINAPASKSSSLRALLCACLTTSKSPIINNISQCDDVLAGIELVSALSGFGYAWEENKLIFKANNYSKRELESITLSVGESGFLARTFVSIGSYFAQQVTINGSGTILKRELGIAEFADKVGLKANNSTLPVTVQGEIKAGHFVISEEKSSQFLSGLLFTLPLLKGDSSITIKKLVSRPYIDLTLSYLGRSGIKFTWLDAESLSIPGKQEYKVSEITPESDWSSLSFIIALAIMQGDITIRNLCDSPNLPDRVILDLLAQVGGNFTFLDANTLNIKKSVIQGFSFDLTSNPDLAPVLVALAIIAVIPSKLFNCFRLRDKESDRLTALIEMCQVLQVKHTYAEDTLTIYPSEVRGGEVKTHNDHRIAMAALILNVVSKEKIRVDNYHCIDKSYPDFLNDLKVLGVEI